MQQIREFRSNFEHISRDCRTTFVRVSHDFPANVAHFRFHSYDSRESVARHSYESRLVLFSRQIVARCSRFLKTVARPLYDTCTTFVRML